MDALNRAQPAVLRSKHFTQLAALHFLQHIVGPGGHFKTRDQLAPEHFQLALVQGVLVVVNGDHADILSMQ